jgi:hypothetical protein
MILEAPAEAVSTVELTPVTGREIVAEIGERWRTRPEASKLGYWLSGAVVWSLALAAAALMFCFARLAYARVLETEPSAAAQPPRRRAF